MPLKKLHNRFLNELREAILLYEFIWFEWIRSDNCSLSTTEVKKIRQYMRLKFQIEKLGTESVSDKTELIKCILRKLETDYPAFKEFVVLNFLYSLIKLAREYDQGYDSFMNTPVHALIIPDNIKNALIAFKVYNVGLLAVLYKENDLLRGPAYQRIVEFQIANQTPKANINLKPIAMTQDST